MLSMLMIMGDMVGWIAMGGEGGVGGEVGLEEEEVVLEVEGVEDLEVEIGEEGLVEDLEVHLGVDLGEVSEDRVMEGALERLQIQVGVLGILVGLEEVVVVEEGEVLGVEGVGLEVELMLVLEKILELVGLVVDLEEAEEEDLEGGWMLEDLVVEDPL